VVALYLASCRREVGFPCWVWACSRCMFLLGLMFAGCHIGRLWSLVTYAVSFSLVRVQNIPSSVLDVWETVFNTAAPQSKLFELFVVFLASLPKMVLVRLHSVSATSKTGFWTVWNYGWDWFQRVEPTLDVCLLLITPILIGTVRFFLGQLSYTIHNSYYDHWLRPPASNGKSLCSAACVQLPDFIEKKTTSRSEPIFKLA
jgi:hypothetical protein